MAEFTEDRTDREAKRYWEKHYHYKCKGRHKFYALRGEDAMTYAFVYQAWLACPVCKKDAMSGFRIEDSRGNAYGVVCSLACALTLVETAEVQKKKEEGAT